jgi:mannan endo-1,4-beta-mannosidase
MNKSILLSFLIIFSLVSCSKKQDSFIRVSGTSFVKNGQPYHFLGTNVWYGINLASAGKGGDRERLRRELDNLKNLGVTNLRIMAGSEGPDTEPYRMVPSMQPSAGEYNQEILEGLDFLLAEMQARDMHAVMCLTNFWNWSGGIPQYLVWAGAADSVPYPPPHPGGNWDVFQKFAASFYSNEKANTLFRNHIEFIVNRKNSVNGAQYREDPTIMSWELANEPRGINNIDAFRKWAHSTAAYLKSLDKNHLVTIGSEGETSNSFAGNHPAEDHNDPAIDYMAFHLWVENWSIFDPAKPDSTIIAATEFAKQYIARHESVGRTLGKPVVLEEFGISRDQKNFDPSATTKIRDRYYKEVFEEVCSLAAKPGSALGGCNFWTWSGEGKPEHVGKLWLPGEVLTGEPPHEEQGWYSIYASDSSTCRIIRDYSEKMTGLK